ncbi:MAG: hypothetical protein DMF10_01510 [Verrucomicrobia bacterium]|nr:MAG: hypothetical protein DMF10_01510 [Verrucomicrobiota bacterium]
MRNRLPWKATPGDFTRLGSIPEPHAFFYGRFLRPENFWLQNCAILRNALRMVLLAITSIRDAVQ